MIRLIILICILVLLTSCMKTAEEDRQCTQYATIYYERVLVIRNGYGWVEYQPHVECIRW